MNEFRLECYVHSDDNQNTKILNLNEKDINQWRKKIEARALTEYYNKKIEVSDKNI